MRAIDFLYEEQQLDEVVMAPKALSSMAARTGAVAGMEFEMIVPDTQDPDGGEWEPDYDADDREIGRAHV